MRAAGAAIINTKVMACVKKKKNIGNLTRCSKMPEYFRSFITTLEGFKATAVQAVDKAFWQAAIKAGYAERIYLWPDLFNNTPEPEETVYQTTPLGKRFVRDGKYEFLFNFSESICFHKALLTHRATSGRIILIDTADNLIGMEDSEGFFRGLKIGMLNPENMVFNTGEEVAMSPVRVQLKNSTEFNGSGAMIDASAFINELYPLTDAKVEVLSADADEILAKVSIECDGTEIVGLGEEDFLLTDAAGDPLEITGLVDNGDGTYSLTGTFTEGGELDLVASEELSLEDAAYEGVPDEVTFGS